jgi:hypothetical protein
MNKQTNEVIAPIVQAICTIDKWYDQVRCQLSWFAAGRMAFRRG